MTESIVIIALALVAAIVAGVELVRTRGQALTDWAVLLLALAILLAQV
jgi:archaellin